MSSPNGSVSASLSCSKVDRSNPDFSRLSSESVRLETFYDWPSGQIVDPCELAKAGLFYTGHIDKVQCAFCRGFFWIRGDRPLDEHRKHILKCLFLQDHANVHNFHTSNSFPMNQPKHPQLKALLDRIHSFSNGTVPPGQTVKQLAAAGFYYVGPGDNVRCFCCDGGLKNLQPADNPFDKHAQWFPHCSFVQKYRQTPNYSQEHNSRQITGRPVSKSVPVSKLTTVTIDLDDLNSDGNNNNNIELLHDNNEHNSRGNSWKQVEELVSVAGDEGRLSELRDQGSLFPPTASVHNVVTASTSFTRPAENSTEQRNPPSTSDASDSDSDFTLSPRIASESTASVNSDQLDVGDAEIRNNGHVAPSTPSTEINSSSRDGDQDQRQGATVVGGDVAAGNIEVVAAAQLDVVPNQQVNIPLPPVPFVDLTFEQHRRLATFVNYPIDARPRPHILARCGFAYIGGHCVRCTLCNMTVNIGLGVRARNFNGPLQALGIQPRVQVNAGCIHMPQ